MNEKLSSNGFLFSYIKVSDSLRHSQSSFKKQYDKKSHDNETNNDEDHAGLGFVTSLNKNNK